MFTHLGFKPRARRAGFANGGLIRGPGTGTSDDIPMDVPVGGYIMPADSTRAIGPENLSGLGFHPNDTVAARVSNGEYAIPPEQVQSIGMQTLDTMRDATHAPGLGFRPQDRNGQKPEMFFDDGGSPIGRWLKEKQKQTAALEKTQQPQGVDMAQVTALQEARNQNADNSSQAGMAGAFANQSDESWNRANERVNQAASRFLPSAPQPAPAPTPTASAGTDTNGSPAAPPNPVPASAPVAATTEQPSTPAAPPPAAGFQPARTSGVWRNGNAFTNNPDADGANAANAPAAPGLGFNPANASSTPAAPGLGFASPGQPVLDANGNDIRRTMDMQRQIDTLRSDRAAENQGPRISVFGDRQQAERDRMLQEYRSLLMNPTLKDLQGSGFYGGRRGQTAGGGEYAARLGAMAQALGLDNQAIANQTGNQTMLERERMQQGGADRRAAAGFAADQPYRDAQTEGLGFQNRAARQMENLRNKYFNARTPEEKNRALEALRAVNGKSDGNLRDNFMTRDVYGPTGEKTGQEIIDLRTGRPLANNPPRTASDAEIEATAKKYGMTPDQVRTQLGLG